MKPKAFRKDQSGLAVETALADGAAMIVGFDPVAGQRFAIALTRFYVDRTVLPDGFPLADDDKETT